MSAPDRNRHLVEDGNTWLKDGDETIDPEKVERERKVNKFSVTLERRGVN